MKRIGCMAVHYGKEYIAWAAKGLAEACDEVHVFYTAEPSFGHVDWSMRNPDTEDELIAEAERFAEITWHRVSVNAENAHRDIMLETARGRNARLVAIADADEVWDSIELHQNLERVDAANSAGRWKANFHNFWRSWKWTVRDHFTPIRIVDLRHSLDQDSMLENVTPIFHFGYAQRVELMKYKISCHGHKDEFKPGWFESKFITWDSKTNNEDLHPCINNFWKAEQTPDEVLNHLDVLMPDHPYRDLELIG